MSPSKWMKEFTYPMVMNAEDPYSIFDIFSQLRNSDIKFHHCHTEYYDLYRDKTVPIITFYFKTKEDMVQVKLEYL